MSPAATATPRVKKLRAELAYVRGDWPTVIELLPALRAAYLLPEAVLAAWEQAAWVGAMTQDDLSASALASLWKQAPEAQKSCDSGLWTSLIEQLRLQSEWGALTKALQGRFDQYCEPASLAVIAVLPRDHAKKLKKSVKRWVSEDLQSGGYAALAMIAHHDNDP